VISEVSRTDNTISFGKTKKLVVRLTSGTRTIAEGATVSGTPLMVPGLDVRVWLAENGTAATVVIVKSEKRGK